MIESFFFSLKIIFTISSNLSIFYFFYKIFKRYTKEERIEVVFLSSIIFSLFFIFFISSIFLFFKIFNFLSFFLASLPFHIFLFFNFKDFIKREKTLYKFSIKNHFLLLVFFIYIFFTIFEGLLVPPLSADSLNYHMLLIGEMIQKQKFEIMNYSPALEQYYHYPKAFQVTSAFFLLSTKSDFLANLVSTPYILIFFLSLIIFFKIYKIENIRFQLGILLTFLVPAFFKQIPTQYSDLPFSSLLLSGTIYLLLYYLENKLIFFFLSFLCFSLSFSTKAAAVINFLIFFIFSFYLLIKRKKINLKIIVLIFIIFLFFANHYIKEYCLFSNPFYPLPFEILGKKIGKTHPVVETYINNLKLLQEENLKKFNLKGFKKTISPYFFSFLKIFSQDPQALGRTSLLFSFLGLIGIFIIKEKFLTFFILCQVIFSWLQFFSPQMESFRLFYSLQYSRLLVYPNALLLIFSIIIFKKNKLYDLLIFLGILAQFFLTLPLNWYKIHNFLIIFSFIFAPLFLIFFSNFPKKTLLILILIFTIISPIISRKKEEMRFFFWENHTHIPPISRVTFTVAKYFWNKKTNLSIYIPFNPNAREFYYLYPFMGKNFENKIYPIEGDLENKDFTIFLSYLKKNKIKYLIFSFPLNFKEFFWIKENPKYFKLFFLNEYFCIFKTQFENVIK